MHAADRYTPGTVVRARWCRSRTTAFIELEEGIEGLVHISEMSWTRRVKHPSKVVAVGDTVEQWFSTSTPEQPHLARHEAAGAQPYEKLTTTYPPGTHVKGRVRNIADFGIFVGSKGGSTVWCTSRI